MPISRTERFSKAYSKLPARIRAKVDRAIMLLEQDFRHPGLRARRVQGTKDIYEARVDLKHRMTYQQVGDVLILRNVGPHDETLARP